MEARPGPGGPGIPPLASALLLLVLTLVGCSRERPDLVLGGGRVVDPESGLDAVRWIAITDGRITRSARSADGACWTPPGS